ncbi:MAG: hypothetical protein CMJ41_02095 [Phycisphaerae bacterium]|nr:hypothetical protein [Phycisphaerae bacterium]HBZ97551.1 hypothetical protein [Phycisphaerales bacterium]
MPHMAIRFHALLVLQAFLLSCGAARVAPSSGVAERRVDLSPGLWVEPTAGRLGFRAWVCLDEGWLEQVVCSPGTREHESLMVTDVPASSIHAGLLLLGLEPGRPGRWREEGTTVVAIPPAGPELSVSVVWSEDDGTSRSGAIDSWIVDVREQIDYPTDRWVFAGSIELQGEEAARAGTGYLADRSGSIIGLVTFGDELLAAVDVIPDAASVRAPEWIAASAGMPPVGTRVTVVLRIVEPGQTAAE